MKYHESKIFKERLPDRTSTDTLVRGFYFYFFVSLIFDIKIWTEQWAIQQDRGLFLILPSTHLGIDIGMLITLCISLLTALFWKNRLLRILTAICAFWYLSFYWSTSYWNGQDIITFVAFPLILYPADVPLSGQTSQNQWKCLRAVRTCIAAPYLLSGINKFLSGVASDGPSTPMAFYLQQPFTDFYMPTDGILTPYLWPHGYAGYGMLVLFAAAMCLAPLAVRLSRFSLAWSLLMVMFHLGNGALLKITYTHQMAVLILFFVLPGALVFLERDGVHA